MAGDDPHSLRSAEQQAINQTTGQGEKKSVFDETKIAAKGFGERFTPDNIKKGVGDSVSPKQNADFAAKLVIHNNGEFPKKVLENTKSVKNGLHDAIHQ